MTIKINNHIRWLKLRLSRIREQSRNRQFLSWVLVLIFLFLINSEGPISFRNLKTIMPLYFGGVFGGILFFVFLMIISCTLLCYLLVSEKYETTEETENRRLARYKDKNFRGAYISGLDMRKVENLKKEQILSAEWGYDRPPYSSGQPALPEDLLQDEGIQEWLKNPHYDYRRPKDFY